MTLQGWTVCAALLLAGVGMAQVPTEPQILYVDAEYAGPEEGTAARPFNSIAEALAVVFPERGDTVRVRPGSYAGGFLLPPDAALVAERGADETFITGDAESTDALIALTEGAVLQGFTVGPTGGSGAVVFGGYSAEVRNCVFFGSFSGAAVADGASLFLYNNTFHGNQVSVNLEPGGVLADARNNIFSVDTVGVYINEGASASTAHNCFFGVGPAVFGGAPGDSDFRANPSLVAPSDGIYHLRASSGVKDRGDPADEFQDIDGTRNDVGADGGPFAVADELSPFVVAATSMSKGGGFGYSIDASQSSDAWGIQLVEWDTDIADGLTYGDASGAVLNAILPGAGRRLIGVRVTDHAGLSTERTLSVTAGDPTAATIGASKQASAPPYRVDLRALQAGTTDAVEWDFGLDGSVDNRRIETTYILPESLSPGTHWVGLTVRDGGVVSQVALPLTLTRSRVIAARPLQPGDTGELVATVGGVLGGTSLEFPQFSVSSEIMAAIAEPQSADVPPLPEGDLAALVEFGPEGQAFSRRLKASVPLRANPSAGANVTVYRWDEAADAWVDSDTHFVRVTESQPPRIEFETAQLGLFAVVASKTDEGGSGDFVVICNQTGEPIFANAMGDLGVLGLLLTAMLAAGLRRRPSNI
ncbi:MAG: hypothetical protein RLZZ303_3009 [Candidatus Hydrogenedentota bacterium]|jgi:hypothetical protein